MNWSVLKSIFKRDFVSYFSSPTGYVFICVFVVLSSLATFWPPEFFSGNLANLDQLSRWLPFIMLVFIPAITMSIWAEEKRQGTDELLLTVPASDVDVVLGKYLAAVAIFTVSLLFSAFSIYIVFKWGLGDPDGGLFASTYVGYWFIGVGMIAIGMVASFLTDNLTVGFILGTLFNLPLALAGVAGWFVKNPATAQTIRHWSALEQFRDFERGVISLGGATYFLMIAAVMVYISLVLIGKRHWQARKEGGSLLGHYLVRTVALVAIAVGVTQIVQNSNLLRGDISSEKLSTLSEDTVRILRDLRADENAKTITIDAYVSPQVPAEYVTSKHNFLSTLAELQALSGNKVQVTKHEIENYGPEAVKAEQTYGITPNEVVITKGRERSQEEFFLGAAVTSGLGKVVIPFLHKGVPVEYELVRSISTVIQSDTLKVGIVDTGIPFLNPSSNRSQEWPLITELRKQYVIDDRPVDPARPIPDNYDVLLAVQPSMLGPQELDHLVDAVRNGIPTAILEDPMPYFYPPSVAGTIEPKQQPGMMGMFNQGGPLPKGNISQLWRTLGVEFNPMEVTWQDYAPEQTVRSMADPQWIFVDQGNGAQEPFNPDSDISSGLNQLLLVYPGSISKAGDSKFSFEPLAVTGSDRSGTVPVQALQRRRANVNVFARQQSSTSSILAAHIRGKLDEDDLLLTPSSTTVELDSLAKKKTDNMETQLEGEETEDDQLDSASLAKEINAVVVTDIDWIIPDFFYIRQSGDAEILPATQNVTFILNIIDALAGDDRFINIRKRTRKHRTLGKIDESTKKYRDRALEEETAFVEEMEEKRKEAQERFDEKLVAVAKLSDLSQVEREQREQMIRLREQDKLDAELKAIGSEQKRKLKRIRYDMEQDIRDVQNRYKLYAILVPPIPPLLVAFYVFFRRREVEREGISQSQLR